MGATGRTPEVQRKPVAAAEKRSPSSSPATEWLNLGFNCGGAALAWVGVVGMSALTPVTGGASAFAAAFMYGGAIAATGQCAVSTFRTSNVYTGRSAINQRLDTNSTYIWTMRAADGIGLVGAGGALREVKIAHTALSAKGFTWSQAARSGLSRPARRQLTGALGLQGSRRVPGPTINRYVRQRLLDGVAGAIGLTASATGGVGKDMVVWIVGAFEE